ncbi:unnamed protein product [Rhizophagus irregularis]|nr:unnamed protein product [Rhizophagus irregularis]
MQDTILPKSFSLLGLLSLRPFYLRLPLEPLFFRKWVVWVGTWELCGWCGMGVWECGLGVRVGMGVRVGSVGVWECLSSLSRSSLY